MGEFDLNHMHIRHIIKHIMGLDVIVMVNISREWGNKFVTWCIG